MIGVADQRDGVYILEFDPPPTPTFITMFDARAVGAIVQVSWEIISDDVVRGYRLYRDNGTMRTLINGGAITVRFIDSVSAPPGFWA